MSATVTYTKNDLEKAKKVLENALGYIERYGFDISESIQGERTVNKKVLDLVKKGEISKIEAKHYGTVCFIGATRIGAGVQPNEYSKGTDYGDGKELTVALELIDKAVEKVNPNNFKESKERVDHDNMGPGTVAEALGFILREQDQDYTIVVEDIFKTALIYIHDELKRKN